MPAMVRIASPALLLCLAYVGLAGAARAADTPTPQTDTPPPPATAPAPAPAKTTAAKSTAKPKAKPSRYTPDRFAGRAGLSYRSNWGIDSIFVRLVESGELIRFTYRVLDPAKAQVLNDKQAQATMDDPKAGVSLLVPTMEKVGALRQTATPEAGRSYWVTFSNKGRRVKKGDRVDVVIGQFKASNLVVD
jgi:hypothetical protein